MDANGLMAPIQNRMPVIVEPADWPLWLGEAEGDAAALLRPAGNDVVGLWPISARVNAPRNNDAGLIEPVEIPNNVPLRVGATGEGPPGMTHRSCVTSAGAAANKCRAAALAADLARMLPRGARYKRLQALAGPGELAKRRQGWCRSYWLPSTIRQNPTCLYNGITATKRPHHVHRANHGQTISAPTIIEGSRF